MKVFLDEGEIKIDDRCLGVGCFVATRYLKVSLTKNMAKWLEGSFTKICVSVNSEEELLQIYESASEQNIPCALITDNGQTEFDGVPTNTCCAIGPDDSEKIDKITGGLKLL